MSFNRLILIATLILFVAIVAAGLLGYLLPQFLRGFLPVDAFTFLITLFLVVAIGLLIYGLFLLIKKQRKQPSSSSQNLPSEPLELPVEAPFIRRRRTKSPLNQSTVDSALQRRLINLLAGDEAAAERLVNRIRQNHPGMPENWYWQRAIEDTKRDRL
jgi:predicted membrane protein